MRVIADDLWFPEGPVWVGDGSLLVVEIRRKTLTRIWLDGRKAIVADPTARPWVRTVIAMSPTMAVLRLRSALTASG